jgi:hypothetical protein
MTGASYRRVTIPGQRSPPPGGDLSGTTRACSLALLVTLLAAPGHGAGDIDRSAADFKTPAEIKWVRNAAGTNEPTTSTPAEKR